MTELDRLVSLRPHPGRATRSPSADTAPVANQQLSNQAKAFDDEINSIINALRGVNPEITQYNYDYSQHAFVRGLPFIPNLGLEFKILP